MAALSTGTYGKATTMPALTDLADRLTAILAAARAAVTGLGDGVATGAPVSQAHVNTLDKALADLGELAVTARQAASDETAQAASSQPADATAGTAGSGTAQASGKPGTAGTAGSGTAKA